MYNETESESETSLWARVSVFRVWDTLFSYKKVLLLPQFWWKHCIERIYESETETESSQSHWLESESETETSPEPRDSVFRVRDERLGKFCPQCENARLYWSGGTPKWLLNGLKFGMYSPFDLKKLMDIEPWTHKFFDRPSGHVNRLKTNLLVKRNQMFW